MNEQRVLVVEDEPLIAMDIGYELEDRGWRVLGPAGRVSVALGLLDDARSAGEYPAVALLDIDLGRGDSFELAERLVAQGVPVVFLSGDRGAGRPAALQSCRVMSKPVDFNLVVKALDEAVRAMR